MSEAKVTRTCNRHHDCDKAEQEAKERYEKNFPGFTYYVSASFHCHNDECEECFGN